MQRSCREWQSGDGVHNGDFEDEIKLAVTRSDDERIWYCCMDMGERFSANGDCITRVRIASRTNCCSCNENRRKVRKVSRFERHE